MRSDGFMTYLGRSGNLPITISRSTNASSKIKTSEGSMVVLVDCDYLRCTYFGDLRECPLVS